MAKESQAESKVAVVEDSNGNPVPETLPGGYTSTGQYTSPFKVVNPPQDKKLKCITDYDMRLGTFHQWAVYTPAQYEEDQRKYQTNIPSSPVLTNGRVEVASHWYVWVPIATWHKMEAARNARMASMEEKQGKIDHMATRHEGTVNITTTFKKSHDGLPS